MSLNPNQPPPSPSRAVNAVESTASIGLTAPAIGDIVWVAEHGYGARRGKVVNYSGFLTVVKLDDQDAVPRYVFKIYKTAAEAAKAAE